MAISQFFPPIQIGSPITYWGPLVRFFSHLLVLIFPIKGFVLLITLIREFMDDMVRWLRDREVNSEKYEKVTPEGKILIKSAYVFLYFTNFS